MQQYHVSQERQRPYRSKRRFLLTLLIFLFLFLGITYTLLRLDTDGAQKSAGGQCLSHGQQFNGRQEAFTLSQQAEQYRASHMYNGNYGYASYTLCYDDGSQQRMQSPVAPGYENTTDTTLSRNETHSEPKLYRWVRSKLTDAQPGSDMLAAIYVIIFSQVRVCDLCLSDMVSWQSDLRQAAKMPRLYLAIWDIQPGTPSAFIPTVFPRGTGTPVAIADLRRVSVRFSS